MLVLHALKMSSVQVMGGDVNVCNHSAGASGITGDTGATGQTGVTGGRMQSYHHRNQVLVLRLEDVIGTSDGW